MQISRKVTPLLLALVPTLLCSKTFAQNYYIEEPRVFDGGIIAGANFTQVDGDSFYGYHKVGITAGGTVYIHFSKSIGVSMDLIYTQKGSRAVEVIESPYVGTYPEKYSMNLNYAEVPVTLHFVAPLPYGVTQHQLDLEAGISYAYLISSKEWAVLDQPAIIDPVANRFNTTDLDYVFGAGTRLYKDLYINIRYQYSIVPIRPLDRVPPQFSYGSSGQYNNLFSIRFQYYFRNKDGR